MYFTSTPHVLYICSVPKKILHTLSLTLLMLFLGGYSRAYAHSKALLSIHTSTPAHQLPHENLFIKPASSRTEDQRQELILTVWENEEDDEIVTYKKQLESGNLPTTILFSQSARPFFTIEGKILSVAHSLSNSPSWYLVLQVFRI